MVFRLGDSWHTRDYTSVVQILKVMLERKGNMNLLQGRRLYNVVALAFLIGAAWTWANRLPDAPTADAARIAAPQKNFATPPFTLTSTDGEGFDLTALKGKVVLVNFWATWCPPCRAEMPAIDAVYRAQKDAGLVVLAVNLQEDAALVKAFGRQFSLSFPLLLDADGAVSVRYQIRALPTTFFVDRRGIIRDLTIGGPMSRELIEGKLAPLLEEKVN